MQNGEQKNETKRCLFISIAKTLKQGSVRTNLAEALLYADLLMYTKRKPAAHYPETISRMEPNFH